jgi:thioredoxin 1
MTTDLETDPKTSLKGISAAIVVFYAPWCADCKASEGFEKRLSEEFASRISFYRFDAVNMEDVADSYGIERYPTWVFFSKARPLRHPLVEPMLEGEARNWLEMRLSEHKRMSR